MKNYLFLNDLYDIARDCIRRILLMAVNLTPGSPGNRLTELMKRALLSVIGIRVSRGCQVSGDFYVFSFGKVRFGRGCRIGSCFKIWNFVELSVGDRLLASHNITIICGTHATDGTRSNIAGPVRIGDDVWIGANVLIVGPAEIGDRSIIGANSFVTGNVPPGARFGGTPARQLRGKSI
jgi:acetyltransferase-like isoleucine patch superfamily enzyme